MMQTLRLLGVSVAGEPWCEGIGTPAYLNPKGFYDLPYHEIKDGIADDRFKGHAVKLFPPMLCATAPERVSRIIVCRRQRSRAVSSTLKMLAVQTLFPGVPATTAMAEEIYDNSYQHISAYAAHCHPTIDVAYEDMTGCGAAAEVLRIRTFAGSEANPGAAIKNIDLKEITP